MTRTAREVIKAFETLSPDEQRQVAIEIVRQSAGLGSIPDEAFDELAADLFRSYDAEEAGRADS